MTMPDFRPTPKDKFAFGVWCCMNIGRDPFGDAVRRGMSGVDAVRKLGEHGAWGFEFHDNDIFPIGATATQVGKIKRELKKVMDGTGIVCATGTTNLFYHPVFKDGAFTSHDAKVRAYTLQKVMNAIDISAELGARNFIFWGGREGAEVDAAKDPVEATKRFREAISFLCEYVRRNKYKIRFTIEPKPNEPRGDIYLPSVGNVLAFIATLDPAHAKMVGVNPEVAHVRMAGLNPYHEYGQALEAGKLFELHLNDQKPLRYDQDLTFASVSLKDSFMIVKLMVDHRFDDIKAFDCHTYRTEDEQGVWDFVDRNMRMYKILEAKVHEVNADLQMKTLLQEIQAQDPAFDGLCARYSVGAVKKIKSLKLDPDKLHRAKRLPYERLDQRLNEILLGVA
jgi:xylose isomerase